MPDYCPAPAVAICCGPERLDGLQIRCGRSYTLLPTKSLRLERLQGLGAVGHALTESKWGWGGGEGWRGGGVRFWLGTGLTVDEKKQREEAGCASGISSREAAGGAKVSDVDSGTASGAGRAGNRWSTVAPSSSQDTATHAETREWAGGRPATASSYPSERPCANAERQVSFQIPAKTDMQAPRPLPSVDAQWPRLNHYRRGGEPTLIRPIRPQRAKQKQGGGGVSASVCACGVDRPADRGHKCSWSIS